MNLIQSYCGTANRAYSTSSHNSMSFFYEQSTILVVYIYRIICNNLFCKTSSFTLVQIICANHIWFAYRVDLPSYFQSSGHVSGCGHIIAEYMNFTVLQFNYHYYYSRMFWAKHWAVFNYKKRALVFHKTCGHITFKVRTLSNFHYSVTSERTLSTACE